MMIMDHMVALGKVMIMDHMVALGKVMIMDHTVVPYLDDTFIPALTIYIKTLQLTDSDSLVLENSNKQIILKCFKIPQN